MSNGDLDSRSGSKTAEYAFTSCKAYFHARWEMRLAQRHTPVGRGWAQERSLVRNSQYLYISGEVAFMLVVVAET